VEGTSVCMFKFLDLVCDAYICAYQQQICII